MFNACLCTPSTSDPCINCLNLPQTLSSQHVQKRCSESDISSQPLLHISRLGLDSRFGLALSDLCIRYTTVRYATGNLIELYNVQPGLWPTTVVLNWVADSQHRASLTGIVVCSHWCSLLCINIGCSLLCINIRCLWLCINIRCSLLWLLYINIKCLYYMY